MGPSRKAEVLSECFVDHTGAYSSYFAGEVNQQAMSSMLKTSVQPIYELELLPVLIAMQVWGNLCAFQQVVYFLDNEPARIGMIKGSGRDPHRRPYHFQSGGA